MVVGLEMSWGGGLTEHDDDEEGDRGHLVRRVSLVTFWEAIAVRGSDQHHAHVSPRCKIHGCGLTPGFA